eukprot:365129-Chlamydomonas_euryale.AAC.4
MCSTSAPCAPPAPHVLHQRLMCSTSAPCAPPAPHVLHQRPMCSTSAQCAPPAPHVLHQRLMCSTSNVANNNERQTHFRRPWTSRTTRPLCLPASLRCLSALPLCAASLRCLSTGSHVDKK